MNPPWSEYDVWNAAVPPPLSYAQTSTPHIYPELPPDKTQWTRPIGFEYYNASPHVYRQPYQSMPSLEGPNYYASNGAHKQSDYYPPPAYLYPVKQNRTLSGNTHSLQGSSYGSNDYFFDYNDGPSGEDYYTESDLSQDPESLSEFENYKMKKNRRPKKELKFKRFKKRPMLKQPNFYGPTSSSFHDYSTYHHPEFSHAPTYYAPIPKEHKYYQYKKQNGRRKPHRDYSSESSDDTECSSDLSCSSSVIEKYQNQSCNKCYNNSKVRHCSMSNVLKPFLPGHKVEEKSYKPSRRKKFEANEWNPEKIISLDGNNSSFVFRKKSQNKHKHKMPRCCCDIGIR